MDSVQVTGQTEADRTDNDGHTDRAISLHEQMRKIVTDIVGMDHCCRSAIDKAEALRTGLVTEASAKCDAAIQAAKKDLDAVEVLRVRLTGEAVARRDAAVQAAKKELDAANAALVVAQIDGHLRRHNYADRINDEPVAAVQDSDPPSRLREIGDASDAANTALNGLESTARTLKSTWWFLLLLVWVLIPLYLIAWIVVLGMGWSKRQRLLVLRDEARGVGASWTMDFEQRLNQLTARAQGELENAQASVESQHAETIRQLNQVTARAQDELRNAQASAESQHAETIRQLRAEIEPRIARIRGQIQQICNAFAASSWQDLRWKTWTPPLQAISSIRIGTITVPTPSVHSMLPEEAEFCVPAMLQFAGGRGMLVKDSGHREVVNNAIQSTMLRLLAMVPPGKLRFTFIDPVGLGQNVAAFMHLQDHDDSLVTGKAWTEPQHIDKCLADVTEHMENVIQKYLRQEFETIEEYNEKAGEVTEPYRVVVIFDFPCNFSETAARRLVSIMRNGSRCGVYTFVVIDATKPMPYGFNLQDLEQFAIVVSTKGQMVSLDLSLPQPEAQPSGIGVPSPPPASQSQQSDSVVMPSPSPEAEPREPQLHEHPRHAQQQAVAPQPVKGETRFDIVLTSAGANATAVREALQVLADRPEQISDDLAGFTLKGYRQEEAAEIKGILEEYGAVVELRGRGQ